MSVNGTHLVIGALPHGAAACARALGVHDDECLFAVRSDVALDGRPVDVWLVVTKD